jgi:hypothetical protein
MCKVLIMTGIINAKLASEFMTLAAIPMSVGNPHGIGYTAVKSDGSIFSEKWHNNVDFLSPKIDKALASELAPYAERLGSALSVNYESYGQVDMTDMTTITMHTRFATCGREFENTHPFIYNDNSLIHNGSINNSNLLKNIISTCDSETALQAYLEQGVNTDSSKSQEFLNMLKGYWAFGILSKDSTGKRILDVYKEGAQLYVTKIAGLGTVFTTAENTVIDVCKALGITEYEKLLFVKNFSHLRFDAVSGEILIAETLEESKLNAFKPYKNSYWNNRNKGSGVHGWLNEVKEPVAEEKKSIASTQVTEEDVEVMMESATFETFNDLNKFLENPALPIETRLKMYDKFMDTEDFPSKYFEKYDALLIYQQNMVKEHDFEGDFFEALDVIEVLDEENIKNDMMM